MEGIAAMVKHERPRRRGGKRGLGACKLCGCALRTERAGRPAFIAPAFAFRALTVQGGDDGEEGCEPSGVTHKAGTRICTRHELVWDVERRKPRQVWAAEGGER